MNSGHDRARRPANIEQTPEFDELENGSEEDNDENDANDLERRLSTTATQTASDEPVVVVHT